MADDPQTSNFANNSIILAAIVSTGALLFNHFAPLQDARPPSKEPLVHEAASPQDVEARLWQDPFAVVAKALKHKPVICSTATVGKDSEDFHCKSPLDQIPKDDSDNDDVSIIGVTMSGAPYAADEEYRRRMRYAVVSALNVKGYVPDDEQHIGFFRVRHTPEPKPTVIAITHDALTLTKAAEEPGTQDRGEVVLPETIPFEVFFPQTNSNDQDKHKKFVVLWLDEDMFRKKPLLAFASLIDKLQKEKKAATIQIIGPRLSSTLLALVDEAASCPSSGDSKLSAADFETSRSDPCLDWGTASQLKSDGLKARRSDELGDWRNTSLENVIFYSDGATVPSETLMSIVNERHPKSNGVASTVTKEDVTDSFQQFLRSKGIHLFRTIATDDLMATALVEELSRRGVRLEPDQRTKSLDSNKVDEGGPLDPQQGQHVALVVEEDTFYGRTFPNTLKNALHLDHCPGIKCQLHKLTYLRGLDGALPQSTGDDNKPDSANSPAASGKDPPRPLLDAKPSELPFGQGQYDYLRRLAQSLKDEDDELKRNGGTGFKAVGVLGTDVFDKLLVLRALKPQFPQAIFFTTDFDAGFEMTSELNWTRNLVIASSFGSQLRKLVQGDIPPFRDVYETSAFLATQLAVRDALFKRNINAPANPNNLPVAGAATLNIGRSVAFGRQGAPSHKTASKKKASARSHGEIAASAFFNDGQMTSPGEGAPACLKSTAPETPQLSGTNTLPSPDKIKKMEAAEQDQISKWLNKPRIFEVGRSGSLLALPTENTSKIQSSENLEEAQAKSCKDELKCDDIQPPSDRLFPFVGLGVRIVCGLIFSAAFGWMLFKLWRYRSVLSRSSDESHQSYFPNKFTFEDMVFYFAFPAISTIVVAFGIAMIFISFGWPYFAEKLTDYGLGEPMRLSEGVSIWPSVVLRLLSFSLSIWLTFLAWTKLESNLAKLSDEIDIELSPREIRNNFSNAIAWRQWDVRWPGRLGGWFKRIGNCFQFHFYNARQGGTFDVSVGWERYVEQGRSFARLCRVLFCVVVMMFFYSFLCQIFGSQSTPHRGDFSANLFFLVTIADIVSMLFLIFFVADATLFCYLFVKELAQGQTKWPEKTKIFFKDKLGLYRIANQHNVLDDCIDLEFIAKRTNCINQLIYYPFAIIALTIVSRSTVFANFSMFLPTLITQGISLLIVIGCAVMLNRIAEKARGIAKAHLSDEIVKAKGRPKDRPSQWRSLLDQVNDLQEGAFLPFIKQPIVGAVLLPLSSFGWTTLVQNGIFLGI